MSAKQLLSLSSDLHIGLPPACDRRSRERQILVISTRDPWMVMERYLINQLAKASILDDMHRRNEQLQTDQRAMMRTAMSSGQATRSGSRRPLARKRC